MFIFVIFALTLHSDRTEELKLMIKDKATEEVSIYYLKMNKLPNTYSLDNDGLSLLKIERPISIERYLELYKEVGDNYQWTDRLQLSKHQLSQVINNSKTSIYLLNFEDRTVGFSELVQENNYVELLYFGLLPNEIGKGFGTLFLRKIIEKAWTLHPQWVQLNTCSLDHPKALSLYQSLGFVIQKTKIKSY